VRLQHAATALLLAATAAAVAQPASAPATPATTASAAVSLTGPARCRFAVPAGWDARQVRWTGDCRGGLAQGLGTLRALQGNQVLQVFYGRLKDGQPMLGAIEVEGGYRAGRFENGQTASAAATEVAQRYQAGGNLASARFYRQKAEQLARQMD
jgi:hypothetical protein